MRVPDSPPAAGAGPEESPAASLAVVPGAAAPSGSRAGSLALDILAQTGWSVLTLAGAFLIRALTDRGAVATTPGVAFGLAYALGVIVFADRAAARANRLNAAFLGSTGAFIASAIVAETTTRFAIFSAPEGLAVLASATAVALFVGRRHDLPALAWTATLAACGTAVLLAFAAGSSALSGILLLTLSTVALWLGIDRWSWRLLPWPPTLCAVALSVSATSLALTPPPASGPVPGAFPVFALALGLPILWSGSVLLRTVAGRPGIGALSIVQTVLALAVGLGGALRLATVRGSGARVLAAIALACGAGSYAIAFLRERSPELRESRLYWAWLGLALVLIGSGVLLPSPAPAVLWSLFALAAVVIARTFEPAVHQPHAAVFAAAAAIASGMLAASVAAFAGPPGDLRWPSAAALFALAALTASTVLLLLESPAAGQLPAFTTALLSAMGLGAVAVLGLRQPASAALAAPLPALRTVVISLSAYALARFWRATGRRELRTLVYLALVAGGLKLLFEDLPGGTPITLFVAFVFYGGALLLIPRLMRSPAPPVPAG